MRLFLALDPGPSLRAAIGRAIEEVLDLAPRARWAEAEKAHLTLVFLGEVDEPRLPAALEAATATASAHGALELVVRGAGTFGRGSRPDVLWAGVEAPALTPLQSGLEERLRGSGFAIEARTFRPHLTLARSRDPRGDRGLSAAARALGDRRFGSVRVEGIDVMQSRLEPGGARHDRLARFPLRGGALAGG